jgi:hypothetical protein
MPKHHTRKRHLRKSVKHHEEALTIPELRRAFEHIEEFAMTHMGDVKAIQEEWKKVFYKELDKESAEEYMAHVKSLPKKAKALRGTRKVKFGGASALGGAPLDYTTRPGIYLTQGGIDSNSYAQVPKYVASGFWNPQMGISYDPVAGQPAWPVPYASTGSNLVKGGGCDSCGSCPTSSTLTLGGKRKTRRNLRKGGDMQSYLQGLGIRTFGSSVPLNPVQSLERVFTGQSGGPSPSAADNKNIKV